LKWVLRSADWGWNRELCPDLNDPKDHLPRNLFASWTAASLLMTNSVAFLSSRLLRLGRLDGLRLLVKRPSPRMRRCQRHLTPSHRLGTTTSGEGGFGTVRLMSVSGIRGLCDLLIIGKEERLGGGLLSKFLLIDERSYDFAISWQMASVSLLKMPDASFAPMSEAFLIWDFQAATSWRTTSLHALSSSNSSWEAPSKGGRGVLHAELILLAKAR
jgi:hypothetical protein